MHNILWVPAFLALVSLSTSFKTVPGRVGCYQDTGEKVWKYWKNSHQKNNVHFCRNMCRDFRYAGMEEGLWCMCGDKLPPKSLPDARCKIACPGGPGQTCGGMLALEVFSVEPKPMMEAQPMGCFKDAPNRVWKTGMIKLQTNSPQRCFDSCRGFKFAGLEEGVWCVCGDHLPPVSLHASECQMQCSGYPSRTCGGKWALEVFQLTEALKKPINSTALPGSVQTNGDVSLVYEASDDLGIYKLFTQRKTWNDAWQQCEDDEAHLLIINSEEEAVFVRSLFAKVPSQSRMHAGFHDLMRKGSYRTLFGKLLSSAGYAVWSPRYSAAPSAMPHCGSLDAQGRLEQVDGNCDALEIFVCEKKSLSPDAFNQYLLMNPRSS